MSSSQILPPPKPLPLFACAMLTAAPTPSLFNLAMPPTHRKQARETMTTLDTPFTPTLDATGHYLFLEVAQIVLEHYTVLHIIHDDGAVALVHVKQLGGGHLELINPSLQRITSRVRFACRVGQVGPHVYVYLSFLPSLLCLNASAPERVPVTSLHRFSAFASWRTTGPRMGQPPPPGDQVC